MSIKRIGIRFNLNKEADRKAWEYLQEAKAVISVINGYNAEQTEQEKQTAFLERILQTVEQSLTAAAPTNALGGLLQLLQQPLPKQEIQANTEEKAENENVALDFIDSF